MILQCQCNDAIFFDLDGTLTDPKPGIVRSIRYAMDRLKIECPDDEDLTWCIGPPLLSSFAELVGESLAAVALEHYRERFSQCGWLENAPYKGIRDTLGELSESGYRLYVATSKPHVFANRIIRHFELDQYFSTVFWFRAGRYEVEQAGSAQVCARGNRIAAFRCDNGRRSRT